MATVSELMASGLPVLLANALGNTSNIAVTAAGSTQATATSLGDADFVYVTSGAGNTGVMLPPAMGQAITAIINSTGNTIIIYGATGEKVNNITSSTGVSVTNGKVFLGVPCNNAWIAAIV